MYVCEYTRDRNDDHITGGRCVRVETAALLLNGGDYKLAASRVCAPGSHLPTIGGDGSRTVSVGVIAAVIALDFVAFDCSRALRLEPPEAGHTGAAVSELVALLRDLGRITDEGIPPKPVDVDDLGRRLFSLVFPLVFAGGGPSDFIALQIALDPG